MRKGHQAYVAEISRVLKRCIGWVWDSRPDHPVMLDNLGMVYFDAFLKTRKSEYLDRAESLFPRFHGG